MNKFYAIFVLITIDLIHKSHNAPVPYPTMHHSEQKCAHFCSEWCIVGYETGALWDLWDWSIKLCQETSKEIFKDVSMEVRFWPSFMSYDCSLFYLKNYCVVSNSVIQLLNCIILKVYTVVSTGVMLLSYVTCISIRILIQWKLSFVLISIKCIWSLQFLLHITRQLCCHSMYKCL